MKLHSESVRQGLINGKAYSAFYTELPNGQYMASIVKEEVGAQGFGEHLTKMCASEEEAVEAINEAWSDLENKTST